MKKLITFIIASALLSGCWQISYKSKPLSPAPSVYVYDAPGCWDEPYYYEPEWCDFYDDGTTCCVWQADGWFEEYCQWGNDFCWDYNGSW